MPAKTRPQPHSAGVGSQIVLACEHTYEVIRRQFPELPDVVFIIGAGSGRKSVRLGHYHGDRWQLETGRIPEIFIAGEGLKRPAADVLTTILHESAHALAAVRKIRETARNGSYHNRKFVALATELGLTWPEGQQPHKTIGYSAVVITPETEQRYERQIARIADAAKAYLHVQLELVKPTADRNNIKLECACGRVIRASKTVAEEAEIICSVCKEPFYVLD